MGFEKGFDTFRWEGATIEEGREEQMESESSKTPAATGENIEYSSAVL
jgi:hypothetical protein